MGSEAGKGESQLGAPRCGYLALGPAGFLRDTVVNTPEPCPIRGARSLLSVHQPTITQTPKLLVLLLFCLLHDWLVSWHKSLMEHRSNGLPNPSFPQIRRHRVLLTALYVRAPLGSLTTFHVCWLSVSCSRASLLLLLLLLLLLSFCLFIGWHLLLP